MHLLLAEDDKVSRDLLRRIIESEGHTVTLSTDGDEAWKQLTAPDTSFDACVFDICMPAVSGLDVVERMRGHDTLKRTPVVMCSAVADRPTVQRAVALGITHFVVKPYSRAVMLDKLRQIRGQLADAFSLEPSDAVCKRLGIDADLHREMVGSVVEEATDWARQLRSAAARTEFEKLFIRGRGIKGSCLSIGVRGAAQKLDPVATLLQHFLEAPEVPPHPFPREQMEGMLVELEREVHNVRQRLKAA